MAGGGRHSQGLVWRGLALITPADVWRVGQCQQNVQDSGGLEKRRCTREVASRQLRGPSAQESEGMHSDKSVWHRSVCVCVCECKPYLFIGRGGV